MQDNLSNLSTIEQKELLVGLLSQRPKRIFPLSLAQQRLWFLDRLYPENPAYNVPLGLHLRGILNRSALESSVKALIQRHETLRTNFETDAGRPVQVVSADSTIEISFVDLAGIPSSDRQLEVHRLGIEEARLPFNLATGPLLRLKLIRLAAEEHLLLCVMHHIVCDGWSLEIFVRELAALYVQYSGGPYASLADLPLQYGDYAKWQLELIECSLFADQAQYWKQMLAGAPAFLHLPADHDRPPEQTFNGASQIVLIPHQLVHSLADFGRTHRATLFMVMLAVFKTLLHFYTRTADILVGVPVAGRDRFELEDLVGFFVNTLVLRTDLSGDPYFRDVLLQVRQGSLDAFAHADLPFEKLVEELNPERTLSYNPVIQVMFSAIKARKFPNLGDLLTSRYVFDSRTSLFDWSVEFIEDEDCCWLRVAYDTSLFGHTRMKSMLDDYLTLLRAVAAEPELRISRLTSLLKAEGDVTSRNGHIPNDQEVNRATAPRRNTQGSHSREPAEPHDALEQILVRIWERSLGITEIRTCDNFFDLGGHSLLAARLISEIEKVVGCKLPLSALFRGSTIESLAEVIRHGTEWSPDPLLMELNAGTLRVPLFAIVQSGVDALGYGLLARHMGTEQPFYKLQAHSPTCHIVPFSIEEFGTIAHEYVAAMQAIQPKGPYCLVGMCNGVHIAEQMVLELERQGHEVGLFSIIDTFVLQHSEIRWLARIEAFRVRRRRYVSQLPLLAQASHYKQAIKIRLRRLLLHEKTPLDPWSKSVWPGREFQSKHFRAPVILFKRPKQPYFKIKDPEMGWGRRSLSEIKICTVNVALHDEMLREPAVRVMAEQLKDTMSHIEKDDSFHGSVLEGQSVTM